jgi:hypothetical protein
MLQRMSPEMCRFLGRRDDDPSTCAGAGVREAPRHEIAVGMLRRCGGRYGDYMSRRAPLDDKVTPGAHHAIHRTIDDPPPHSQDRRAGRRDPRRVAAPPGERGERHEAFFGEKCETICFPPTTAAIAAESFSQRGTPSPTLTGMKVGFSAGPAC